MHDLISFLSQNDKLVTSWTAIAALFVSIISIVIAVVNMGIQRAHNRKSVLPIANLSFGDYESAIFVRLQNVGVGPMIVESLVVARRDKNDESTGKAIIDFMPELPSGHDWSHFVHDIAGRRANMTDCRRWQPIWFVVSLSSLHAPRPHPASQQRRQPTLRQRLAATDREHLLVGVTKNVRFYRCF